MKSVHNEASDYIILFQPPVGSSCRSIYAPQFSDLKHLTQVSLTQTHLSLDMSVIIKVSMNKDKVAVPNIYGFNHSLSYR
jgi:hypothetical protein